MDLHCCTQASLVVAAGGYYRVAMPELLILMASLAAEHKPQGIQASIVVASELSSWGSQALEHGLSSCGTQG